MAHGLETLRRLNDKAVEDWRARQVTEKIDPSDFEVFVFEDIQTGDTRIVSARTEGEAFYLVSNDRPDAYYVQVTQGKFRPGLIK